jgi:hypothetical protein
MGQNVKIIKKEKTNNMTAVEWLIERLHLNNKELGLIPIDIIQQAKAMEKEQIVDAYCDGSNTRTSGEEYYKEAYESHTNL